MGEVSQQSTEYNTIVGNTQDLSQDVEMTQDIDLGIVPEIISDIMPELSQEILQELSLEEMPEVSRRVTRKRKRT